MDILSTLNIVVSPLAIPFTMGLVEVLKRLGVNSRFLPLFSVLFGVGTTFLLNPSISLNLGILGGVLTGLTTSGLWSGVKSSVK